MRCSDCRDPSTSAIDSGMHRTRRTPSRRIGVTACNSSAVAVRLRDSVLNLRPEGTQARQKAFAIHRSLPTPGTSERPMDAEAPYLPLPGCDHVSKGCRVCRQRRGFPSCDGPHGSAAQCGRSSQHEPRSTGTGSRLEQKPLGEIARPVVVEGLSPCLATGRQEGRSLQRRANARVLHQTQ